MSYKIRSDLEKRTGKNITNRMPPWFSWGGIPQERIFKGGGQ